MVFIAIGFIPISAIILFFAKDANPNRQKLMRGLLILNFLLFLSPLIYTFIASYPDENMWSDNGSGAAMWAYLILGPVCFLIQIVLMILRITFAKSAKQLSGGLSGN
ncbi:MAG: hypothetical protein AAF587_05715 [Bacteroidota bacterium]